MIDLTVSIVCFEENPETMVKCLNSILESYLLKKIFIIDNSKSNRLSSYCDINGVEYIFNKKNLGFGAGHNIAIKKALGSSRYHLVVNPDIYFSSGTLEKLYKFMEQDSSIGLVMPKVLYPDGSIQYLCRLLPTPLDLIARRTNIPVLNKRLEERHALKFTGYEKLMDVPYLSGCFMFIRTDAFYRVGIFDERFFLYMEDVDLARRMRRFYRNVYFPEASVYHSYNKASYRGFMALARHVFSAFSYFNKWGWFFDEERKLVNNDTLNGCLEKHP